MKLLITTCLLLVSFTAHAQTNLVMGCADEVEEGAGPNVCKNLQYLAPDAGSKVIAVTGTVNQWSLASWTTFSKLPDSARVVRCHIEVPANLAFKAGVAGTDPCPSTSKSWMVKNPTTPSTTIQARFTWNIVSTYTDGKAIAPADHLGYELVWWRDAIPHEFKSVKTGTVNNLTITVPNARLCATISTLTRSGASDPSPVNCQSPGIKPPAPVLIIDFP